MHYTASTKPCSSVLTELKHLEKQYGASVETNQFTRDFIQHVLDHCSDENKHFLKEWWTRQLKLQHLPKNNH